MKSLDRQEKLMAFVTVQVEICTRRNVLIYYKASGIEMQDLAVAWVKMIVVHNVIEI